MKIKEILEYDWNYAEYLVTDGKYDIICMCISVPLPNDIIPKTGMLISNLYAFTLEDFKIEKIINSLDKKYMIKKGKSYFEYSFYGKIIDLKKALVQVFGFIISLEYKFANGLPPIYSVGDFIKIEVDRLDCCIQLN